MRTLIFSMLALVTTWSASAQDAAQLVPFEGAGDGPAYVVPIEGMIDNGLAVYLERAIADAADGNASVVILHIDTFGGLVDAADAMRKAILNSPVPTVAFIDPNAASAGALISYAADRIVMVPGGSIGAATVVEGAGGEAAPDKYQSYMRGLMRSTAEANGRDPAIAEAMVDETIAIEGIVDAGKVLTLSTKEAVELGVADAELTSINAVLSDLGLENAPIVYHELRRTEKIIRFFGSPVVQSILMLMMLGGLYFELQTPGVGFPGLMAALGASMFFGPAYLNGLVESWEVVVFVLGVGLLLVEIFVIPGFGVAGISGLILIVLSLVVSLIANVGFSFPSGDAVANALLTLASTMLLFVGMVFGLGKVLPRSSRFNQLVLQPTLASTSGYTSSTVHADWVGRTGITLTALRPSGAVEMDGERIDVVTAGDYIEAGVDVRIVRVNGSRIEVRRV
jgi:membrane-bound serine protease (ClpP class)